MTTTISDEISSLLAEDIINGVFKPGQKLEEQAIAKRFDVSRTPVRDAFKQLALTGLIDSRPHRGVTVVELDLDQINDLFEALSEAEGVCARLSAQRMKVIERKQLETLFAKEASVLAAKDDLVYFDYNELFHSMIHNGAHNKVLAEIAQDLRRRLSPFRRSTFFKEGNWPHHSSMEHEELVEAILAADAEKAYNAMRSHVASSALNAISYIDESRNDDET
jgi:DNA-binding GntR family transcriptional regulator